MKEYRAGKRASSASLRGLVTDVFFDLDHTLWDFERNSALAFETVLKNHEIGVDVPAFLEAYHPINLHYWKEFREGAINQQQLRYQRLKATFEALSCPVNDELIEMLSVTYLAQLPTHTHLCTGAQELLEYLQPQYRLHIITNGFEEVQFQKLTRSGIHSYFNEIVHSETIGIKKPDRRIFEWALEKARVAPQQAVMIGDSLEVDILGAKEAGMHAIHVNAHGEVPHLHSIVVDELPEIQRYL